MKLAIVVAATKSYLYAWKQCVQAIAGSACHHKNAHFIFCTDESEEATKAAKILEKELPEGWQITTIRLPIEEDPKDYEASAQLRIAALQGAGLAFARTKVRADRVWSVESDNIVYANTLRVLEWGLDMPQADGTPLYGVVASPYWNGQILCGHGSPTSPIHQDFLPHEKRLKPRLRTVLQACEARMKSAPSEKEGKRMARLVKRTEKLPPDGSLWEVTQKYGWRRRGWFENCYPGIGEGALVPVGWCGLGSTLMGKHALQLADFNGYSGGGTQDLFLVWQRWHQAGIRIACAPHVPVDHVKRNDNGELTQYIVYHEQNPDYKGHLRLRVQPFIPDPLNYRPVKETPPEKLKAKPKALTFKRASARKTA